MNKCIASAMASADLEFLPMTDADEPKTKSSHTLGDHVYGLDLEHTHDGYADHDHDFPDESPLEENPIWIADHVSLMTVGIDIGSSRTQVVFLPVHLGPLCQGPSTPHLRGSPRNPASSHRSLTP